jgi:4-hydroxy-tetrahydrodipicolinate reductase
VLHLVASAIGLTLDSVEETHEIIRADEDITIASGTVAKGTISGMRFEIIGLVDGEERIVVEHVTRLRDDDAPDWPQGQCYRILIEGDPHLKLELELSSDHGDHNHAGCLATALHVVNAIPHVVAATPGVKTLLDLPVYSAAVR